MNRRTRTRQNQAQRSALGRGKRGRLVLPVLVVAALVVSAFCLAACNALDDLPTVPPTPEPKTAVIVDQLGLTYPNPAFAQAATAILEQAGYVVTYVPGEQVTVDFYRTLAAGDYDLVILRIHSAIIAEVDTRTGQRTEVEYVGLFTGEPYDETKRFGEWAYYVGRAVYHEGAAPLFGIVPAFIEDKMLGEFDGTLIVMMGCHGMLSDVVGQAFLDRGASAFVGWDEAVSASHTDAATQYLLEQLFIEGRALDEAVARTRAEIGPDPAYGAELQALVVKE